MTQTMNILAAATTLNVHYTTAEVFTEYQTPIAPICRKSKIAGYVKAPGTESRPVNCPKCINLAAQN